jgi:hypothetical protein
MYNVETQDAVLAESLLRGKRALTGSPPLFSAVATHLPMALNDRNKHSGVEGSQDLHSTTLPAGA